MSWPRRLQPETGSVTDRFLAHLHNLVKVRELNETAGDDPQALVSQIEAGQPARRYRRARLLLSTSSPKRRVRRRAIGRRWPARGLAAEAALQSIREAAVGQLAGGPKP